MIEMCSPQHMETAGLKLACVWQFAQLEYIALIKIIAKKSGQWIGLAVSEDAESISDSFRIKSGSFNEQVELYSWWLILTMCCDHWI